VKNKSFLTWAFLVSLFVLSGFWQLNQAAYAQLAYTLTSDSGETLDINYKDQPRTANTLVLYSPEYGPTTQTNPHGVEVTLNLLPDGSGQYGVSQTTSVWECQKQGAAQQCGDASIPADGWVLSASDDTRQKLLRFVQSGSRFTLTPIWFASKTVDVTTINPNETNNKGSCGFPGCRGGNQLVIYNPNYGEPTTGTNEFGFEVTVVDGVVVAQEGANSHIPYNGFVVSGHGSKRAWLIANAPIGARIFIDATGTELTSQISPATYRDQLVKRYQEIRQTIATLAGVSLMDGAVADSMAPGPLDSVSEAQLTALDHRFQELLLTVDRPLNRGDNAVAAQSAVEGLTVLNHQLWSLYPSFATGALQGVWHRPTELTAAAIGKTLDGFKADGFNAVFLETYFHGYTIFPSETYKIYGLPTPNPKFAQSGDLLQLWIDQAHQRDMQVHVWFETFYAGNKQAATGNQPLEGPVLAKYPEWANIQYSALESKKLVPSTLESGAYFLDPANTEACRFVSSLIHEVVSRYNVDGFQLDYIRYPASFPQDRFSYLQTTWGYTPTAREQFKALTDFDPKLFTKPGLAQDQASLWRQWNNFKTAKVTDFVKTATADIRHTKPTLAISAAVFPKIEDSLERKHQDWATWGQNHWVDFLAPMTLTSAIKVVAENTHRMIAKTNGSIKVYSGIFGPFNNNSAEDVLAQIDAARRVGAQGYIVFDSAHLTNRINQALSQVHGTPTGAAPHFAVK